MNVAFLLRANARRQGQKICLVFNGQEVSYGWLDKRVDCLVRGLKVLGLERGKKLALFLRNSIQWVELFFAASRAGVVLVPVSFRSRGEELKYILEHSRPDALAFDDFTRPVLEEILPEIKVSPVYIAAGEDLPPWAIPYRRIPLEGDSQPLWPEPRLADLHSICYTSGSTGKPKGVMLTNANVVVGQYFNCLTVFPFKEEDVFVITTPLCHRTGWGRLVQAVGLGSTVCLLGTPYRPKELVDIIASYRATVVGMVPTMARMLLEEVPVERLRKMDSWRGLLLTGESCPVSLKERLWEVLPAVQLYSFYASTETGMISCLWGRDQMEKPHSVGRPVPGVEVTIADPGLGSGEILVRSGAPGDHTVMLGYYQDEMATREALRDGWFHTGDVGSFDGDGYLYITDRVKDLIITGGLNVSSREVEDVLLQCPGVREAAVIGVPDDQWGEAIKAFVVADNGISEEEIRSFCARRLAGYKKPRYIQFVASLPRTATGKLRKQVLREWEASGRSI
ncbi:long-chain acyl-CoA synthetase [Desulfofundulus luciae]|uniref:Long-chain acyl-CoA synthetase n=1 Tax=Desulfofundulus luciae TaxID=74702 RepID=A0ABU0B6E9_9FIRM|nr:class I adenylate-forming enzyme family protein [Desulfofundulus luciae]MDQ0287018.1 long-chain acyl-CoA synthetase [Desulfofundulus luciae]